MDLYNEIRADLESKEKVGFSSLDEAIDYYKCNLKVYELSQQNKQAEKERELIAWLEDYKALKEEKPVGKWIWQNDDTQPFYGEYMCSECGAIHEFTSQFCSDCGCKMIGKALLSDYKE